MSGVRNAPIGLNFPPKHVCKCLQLGASLLTRHTKTDKFTGKNTVFLWSGEVCLKLKGDKYDQFTHSQL